jgi:antitoxin MazE
MLTRIARWGNSQAVRLSRATLERAGLAVGDEVSVEAEADRIVLERPRRIRGRYRLEELVARVPKEYRPAEQDWGEPVGSEEW